jgi:hypothetical protein
MQDFFNDSSPSVLDGLHEVFRSLPHFPGSKSHAMPRINEGRWFSLTDLVHYLSSNGASIEAYLSEKRLHSAHSTFIALRIPELNQVLQKVSILIRTLEANSAVYSDVFLVFSRIPAELHSLTTNRYQKSVTESLVNGVTSTADLSLIVTTFLLTPRGVAHIRTLQRDSDYAKKLQTHAELGLSSLCAIFHLPQVDLVEMFKLYLWNFHIPAQITSASQLWANFPPFAAVHAVNFTGQQLDKNTIYATQEVLARDLGVVLQPLSLKSEKNGSVPRDRMQL